MSQVNGGHPHLEDTAGCIDCTVLSPWPAKIAINLQADLVSLVPLFHNNAHTVTKIHANTHTHSYTCIQHVALSMLLALHACTHRRWLVSGFLTDLQ